MASCKTCGKPTKFSHYEFCSEHYIKQDNKTKPKKGKINDSLIKGKIAETIIERMFVSMGYDVFRYGMENTVPGFGKKYKFLKGDEINEIHKMPDFIVVGKPGVAYVEVKYRTNGKFNFKKYYQKGVYPYPKAFFILVSPNNIKIQIASELIDGKEFIDLEQSKYFKTKKGIVSQYINFCKKFFGNC